MSLPNEPPPSAGALAAVMAAVSAQEPSGLAQWYVDEWVIDCDAELFWQVVADALERYLDR